MGRGVYNWIEDMSGKDLELARKEEDMTIEFMLGLISTDYSKDIYNEELYPALDDYRHHTFNAYENIEVGRPEEAEQHLEKAQENLMTATGIIRALEPEVKGEKLSEESERFYEDSRRLLEIAAERLEKTEGFTPEYEEVSAQGVEASG